MATLTLTLTGLHHLVAALCKPLFLSAFPHPPGGHFSTSKLLYMAAHVWLLMACGKSAGVGWHVGICAILPWELGLYFVSCSLTYWLVSLWSLSLILQLYDYCSLSKIEPVQYNYMLL